MNNHIFANCTDIEFTPLDNENINPKKVIQNY